MFVVVDVSLWVVNGGTESGAQNGDLGKDNFPPLDIDMEDEDDGEFSISKIKSQLGFADDEEGTFLGVPKDSTFKEDSEHKDVDDDAASVVTTSIAPPVPVVKLPEIQKPFQPGMSPEHLNDRYMLWNNVGIVRQYSSEDENSIDIEFHDTSVHHSLHFNNSVGHSMAALSTHALALACESSEDQPSKLVVHHFSGWGTNKEWYVDLPEEDIQAVCLGSGWLAVATDRRNLRIFSTSGIQRDILAIPGPVVCLAGFEDQIMLVYHGGMGVCGDQHLESIVLNVSGGRHPVPVSCPVPLSPRSFLAWAGFSDEGTPVIMDSTGVVRIMHFKYGYNWTNILDTKKHTRGKSDHYFLLGVNETQGNVRSILCKGSRYPPVLPKPHVSIINIQIPLCELETEKGELEEKAARTGLLMNTLTRLNQQGFEVDTSKSEAEKIIKETMIKLFALACRTERESRALEVCQLMPSYHTVELAIKYAGKLRLLQLADRLGEVASAKLDEELEKESKSHIPVEDDLQRYGGYTRRIRARSPEEEEDEIQEHSSSHCQQEEENGDAQENPLLAAVAARRESIKGSPRLLTKQATLKRNSQEDVPVTSGKESQSENTTGASARTETLNVFRKKETSPQPPVRKQSALQLWLADSEESVKSQYPEASEKELLAKAALMFKDLDNDTKQRPQVLEEVEKLLLVWLNEKQLAGDSISEAIICKRVRKIHSDVLQNYPSTSAESDEFKASKWRSKIKPLVVYHFENPWAFKQHSVNKARLPMKDWATRSLLLEWLHKSFAPTARKYLADNLLPDGQCTGTPSNMNIEYDFIKVKFISHNATPLLQPMDQQVISNFKKLYTKGLFTGCFNVTEETSLTLKEFWRNHFNIKYSHKLQELPHRVHLKQQLQFQRVHLKQATPVDDDKKRKREEVIEESPVEKETKGSGLKKLALLSLGKES
nr:WD repeat and HMG-box DNA-binding protein 1-like [Cherax quadricarinatus]